MMNVVQNSKKGKAVGLDEVTAEMVKHNGDCIHLEYLSDYGMSGDLEDLLYETKDWREGNWLGRKENFCSRGLWLVGELRATATTNLT